MPEISHELSEVAWCAFRDSNKPAPYNQIRDALEAYEVAKNESAEAAITKALERLEAIASYQPRPNMKRELRELAEIFRLGLAKPKPSPAGGVREALAALGPFASTADHFDDYEVTPDNPSVLCTVRLADLRRARTIVRDAALPSPATPEPALAGGVRDKIKAARKHLVDGDPLSAWRALDAILSSLSPASRGAEPVAWRYRLKDRPVWTVRNLPPENTTGQFIVEALGVIAHPATGEKEVGS